MLLFEAQNVIGLICNRVNSKTLYTDLYKIKDEKRTEDFHVTYVDPHIASIYAVRVTPLVSCYFG